MNQQGDSWEQFTRQTEEENDDTNNDDSSIYKRKDHPHLTDDLDDSPAAFLLAPFPLRNEDHPQFQDAQSCHDTSHQMPHGCLNIQNDGAQDYNYDTNQINHRRKRSRSNVTWDERLEELQQYKEMHGHCNVPYSKSGLGQWLSMQRQAHAAYYRNMFNPEESSKPGAAVLTRQKINLLKQLGVQLEQRRSHLSWDEHIQELQEYKNQHGNCRVMFTKHGLGHWLKRVGQAYHHSEHYFGAELRFATQPTDGNPIDVQHQIADEHHEKAPNGPASTFPVRLTPERVEQLTQLGVDWEYLKPKNSAPKSRCMYSWNQRIEQLVAFKVRHGHCKVDNTNCSEFQGLYRWLSSTRQSYRLLRRGRPHRRELVVLDHNKIADLRKLEVEFLDEDIGEDKFDGKASAEEDLVQPIPVNLPNRIPIDPVPMEVALATPQPRYDTRDDNRPKCDGNDQAATTHLDLLLTVAASNLGEPGIGHTDELEIDCRDGANSRAILPQDDFGKFQPVDQEVADTAIPQPPPILTEALEEHMLLAGKKSGSRTNSNARWSGRIKQLIEYRTLYGHCNIPKAQGGLGRWLSRVRSSYNRRAEGRPKDPKLPDLSDQQIVDLINVGVDLKLRRANGSEGRSWNERIEQLKAFKDEHGHLGVPRQYAKFGLGCWLSNIRKHFATEGEKGISLPREQVQELLDMGVELQSSSRGDVIWTKHLKDLESFRKDQGHCDIPYAKQGLGLWLSTVRQSYQRFILGEPAKKNLPHITPQRVSKLLAVGVDLGRFQKHVSTAERMKQLQTFKDQHGHTDVPCAEDGLGHWLRQAKASYRLLKIGRPVTGTLPKLTSTMIKQLAELGVQPTEI